MGNTGRRRKGWEEDNQGIFPSLPPFGGLSLVVAEIQLLSGRSSPVASVATVL